MRDRIEQAAQCCHEANRAYCQTIGDGSQLAWADAPQWQRDSAIAGVKHVFDNPTAQPSDSHESWLAAKTADGWKYGPFKDADKKEHPCFVPYDQLSSDQKFKDVLFLAIARSFMYRDMNVR